MSKIINFNSWFVVVVDEKIHCRHLVDLIWLSEGKKLEGKSPENNQWILSCEEVGNMWEFLLLQTNNNNENVTDMVVCVYKWWWWIHIHTQITAWQLHERKQTTTHDIQWWNSFRIRDSSHTQREWKKRRIPMELRIQMIWSIFLHVFLKKIILDTKLPRRCWIAWFLLFCYCFSSYKTYRRCCNMMI